MEQIAPPFPNRFIRLPEVRAMVGLSQTTIYRRMQDATFPQCRKIGPKAVAWVASEIDQWMQSCIAQDAACPS